MSTLLRNATLVVLPVITLFLGWQMGSQQERHALNEEYSRIEMLMGGSGSGTVMNDPEQEVDMTLLWSVWRILMRHYIEPEQLQTTPMVHGAVSGLVSALDDPYTSFMPPQENREFRESLNGRLEGIGAELTERNGMIVIVAPLKGSPAEAAGLLPEDVITHVDGESIEGWTLSESVSAIRGPKGSQVMLTVSRPGETQPVDITITRDEIKVPSTEAELKEHNGKRIGYVAINRFGDTTSTEVGREIQNFVAQNVDGLILDVRFNGGGYLDKAVDLGSMFLSRGKIVSVARREGEPVHHYATGRPIAPDVPLVILVNEGSASASEILAGALQDNGRATVVGKDTFGKGTVQEVFELPGGTSLRVTTAKWLTPNGKDLGKEGVHPDIEIDRTREDIEAGNDPQLEAALESITY